MSFTAAKNWFYTAVSRKVVQQKRMRQCGKVLWVMGVHGSLIEALGVSVHREKQHSYM